LRSIPVSLDQIAAAFSIMWCMTLKCRTAVPAESPRFTVKKIERVRAFFRFAVESGWIEKNPAKLVRGAATIKDTQKLPFEPKEMERIVETCWQAELERCTNNELLAFVLVLRYSGLRIGDASMLTEDRFKKNDRFLLSQ